MAEVLQTERKHIFCPREKMDMGSIHVFNGDNYNAGALEKYIISPGMKKK